MAEDKLRPLRWTRERQLDDAVAQLRVGLHDGLLGALGFLRRLAPLHVGRVNLRPPRRKEDRIAIAAGGKSVREPADQPYGDRMSGVLDPFGYKWWIATHIKDMTAAEIGEASGATQAAV